MTKPTSQNRRRIPRVSIKALVVAGMVAAIGAPLTASAADKQKITAQVHGERISVSVPTALLDTDEGTARIYLALQRKAEKSCKTTIRMKVSQTLSIKRCAADLMDGFVADLGDAGMTALHTTTE